MFDLDVKLDGHFVKWTKNHLMDLQYEEHYTIWTFCKVIIRTFNHIDFRSGHIITLTSGLDILLDGHSYYQVDIKSDRH